MSCVTALDVLLILNGDAVDGNGRAVCEPGFHPVGIHIVATGKQFVYGEPHFYVRRCLFGCPKPCQRTGVSCKIVAWMKLVIFALPMPQKSSRKAVDFEVILTG